MKVFARAAASALVMVVTALPAGAQASFPGQNGKLLFTPSTSDCLATVSPDGTGVAATPLCGTDGARFSPDGTRVVYNDRCIAGVWTAKLDGSDAANVESSYPCYDGQAWSPDGRHLVISSFTSDSASDHSVLFTYSLVDASRQSLIDRTCPPDTGCVFLFSPDWSPGGAKILYGSDGTVFTIPATGGTATPLASGSGPSWSPYATRVAFVRAGDIWTMAADGSGQVNVTNSAATESHPIWSPDGTKIAFQSGGSVWTMNADGTGATPVTAGSLHDWQPVPYTGYPRPKGAGPFLTYLVPAYQQCTAPNRTHGAPLAFPSCAPPQQASGHLTLGTPDANGQGAKSRGSVKFAVRASDVAIGVAISDVRNKADLTDYAGELQVSTIWRVTDRYNGPSLTEPATMIDIPLPTDDTCATTADTTVGSTCDVTTSANAIVPAMIRSGKRMLVELGQVQVYDGGADGNVETSDNTLFLDQGILIP